MEAALSIFTAVSSQRALRHVGISEADYAMQFIHLKKNKKKNAHSALNTLSEFMQHAEHRTGGNLNNQPYGPTAPLVSLCRDATKIISTSNV